MNHLLVPPIVEPVNGASRFPPPRSQTSHEPVRGHLYPGKEKELSETDLLKTPAREHQTNSSANGRREELLTPSPRAKRNRAT